MLGRLESQVTHKRCVHMQADELSEGITNAFLCYTPCRQLCNHMKAQQAKV